MKYTALTLTAPYGTLVAIGAKKIETRSWSTSYRGTLLIHQGSNLKPVGGDYGLEDLCHREPFRSVLFDAGDTHWGQLDKGAIVAVCELVDCRRTDEEEAQHKGGWFKSMNNTTTRFWELTDQERAFGDYERGRFAWLLADVHALPEPIAARGYPGLWDWEGDLGL